MTTRQNLERLSLLNSEINDKLDNLEQLKQRSTAIGGFDYAQDRVQVSPPNNATYTSIVELIVEKEEEIDRLVDEATDLRNAIDSRICTVLSKEQHDVFILRIYYNMEWHKIANTLGYSESKAHRKYMEALNIIKTQDIDF